jgi:beta-lactamase regulating signal transducer with metallopeptidase domain/Skp family chaperone for outer membrane proteins
MNDWAIDLMTILVRSTLVMSLSAVLVLLFLKFVRVTSPRLHRLACFAVILQGWLLVQIPMTLPTVISRPVSRLPVFGSVPSPLEGERGVESREALAPSPWPSPPPRGRGDQEEGARNDSLPAESIQTAAMPAAVIQTAAMPAAVIETKAMPTERFTIPWALLAVALWGAGIVAHLVRSVWAYLMFIRRLPTSLPVSPEWAAEWIDLQRQAGVRRFVPLQVVPEWGPLLCWHPRGVRLIVPAEFWSSLTPEQRRPILRHELAHLVRRDIFQSLCIRLLALPYWFNPLVWRLVRRFDDCAEWACDEAVRSSEADNLTEYARTLLQLGESAGSPQLATSAIAGGSGLTVRIRRLLNSQPLKDSIMKKMAMVLLMLGLVSVQVVRVQLNAEDQPAKPAEPAINGVQASGAVTIRQGSGSSEIELTADRLVLFTDFKTTAETSSAGESTSENAVVIQGGATLTMDGAGTLMVDAAAKRTEAVVDMRHLLAQTIVFQREREKFKAEIAEQEEKMKLAQGELNAMREKYRTAMQQANADAEVVDAYRVILKEKINQFEAERKAAKSGLLWKETQMNLGMYGKVVAEVTAYAKEQGIRIVRRKNFAIGLQSATDSMQSDQVRQQDSYSAEKAKTSWSTAVGAGVRVGVVGKSKSSDDDATPSQLLQKIMEKEIIYAEADQEYDITEEILKRLNAEPEKASGSLINIPSKR